jgi:NAD-dependent dihydropyrimidine dehydrogenase PreA subunit
MMIDTSGKNTLRYDRDLCNGCGMCRDVCPHAVFSPDGGLVQIAEPDSCMECGACQLNCPTGALEVDSGVGCATAMILAALTRKKEATCGPQLETLDQEDCGGNPSSEAEA